MEANLIVTYIPAHPGKAKREVVAILDDFGKFDFLDESQEGIFLIHVDSPKKLVRELRTLPADSYELTFKWIPIETWVMSDMSEISGILNGYNDMIRGDESWKLVLFKRNYSGHDTMKLIELLTENIIHEKVDLKNPDKLVVVEIIGQKAGLSLLEAAEYLDTQKM